MCYFYDFGKLFYFSGKVEIIVYFFKIVVGVKWSRVFIIFSIEWGWEKEFSICFFLFFV